MSLSTSKKLIIEAKPYLPVFLLAIAAMAFSGLIGVLPSWFIKISIDGLAALEAHNSTFCILPKQLMSSQFVQEHINLDMFYWQASNLYFVLPLSIIGLFSLEAIFKFIYQYNSRKLGLLVVKSLREKFHQHINQLSIKQHKDLDSGSLVSVVTSDLQSLQSWLAETVMNLFSESFSAFFLALWLLVINWKLTLVSALVIPLFALPVVKIGKSIRSYAKKGQDFVGNNSSFVAETIRNQTIIKAYNLETWRNNKFFEESKILHKLFDKWAYYMALVSPLTNLIGACGIAVILFLGLQAVSQELLTVGEFSSFFVTSILMYDPIKRLGRVATIFQSALGVADRVYDFLEMPVQEAKALTSEQAKAPEFLEGCIEFKHVNFSYDTRKIFDDFNLVIPAKTSLALVGPSGGGKTSLINLLPRFYEIDSGSITIDSIDIKHLDLHHLRSYIAFVTQEPLLFSGTIRENILLGLDNFQEYSLEEQNSMVEKAARESFVENFLIRLENGLDSDIGEGGSKLSIGQKQRIALARAFISQAPIIVLDEPTSALDNESQEFVYRSINKLMETRTVIIIAHRLSTIKSCDKIVYLKEGKILEAGSHEELLKQDAAYAALLK